MRSVPRCYKRDKLRFNSWRLVSSARKLQLNGASQRGQEPLDTETEDIVGIRHQATTDEDFMCAVVTVICEVCRTVKAYSFFSVTSCEGSINPITNPNPVHSHYIM
jgi:hypothetical protein